MGLFSCSKVSSVLLKCNPVTGAGQSCVVKAKLQGSPDSFRTPCNVRELCCLLYLLMECSKVHVCNGWDIEQVVGLPSTLFMVSCDTLSI